jgi:acyl-CoA thioesterase YciA
MSMIDQALQRPSDFARLSAREQWRIDKSLGLLDWNPSQAEGAEFNRRWAEKYGVIESVRNIAIRRLLLPRDTNHRGEVFGGAILAEIDLAGAVEARKHTEHDVATVAVKEVQFKRPVQVGDVVTFFTSVTKVGTSSIHIRVEVEASRDGEAAPHSVTAAELVYVTIARKADGTIEKVPVTSK